jgi:hypothetical protein
MKNINRKQRKMSERKKVELNGGWKIHNGKSIRSNIVVLEWK